MTPPPAVVNLLVSRAVEIAATIGHVLSRLEPELVQVDRNGIEDEGPSTEALIAIAQEAGLSYVGIAGPDASSIDTRRLADVVTRAWLSDVKKGRQTRPDVLLLTCRVLASASEPESYPVARFAVVLALRALYEVTYTNETLRSLRSVYDDLEQRFRNQQSRRFRKNPIQHEGFLLDLLFLVGGVRRTLAGPNLQAYYDSFRNHPLGVAPGGRREFDESQHWPQIYGDLPDFPWAMAVAFSQPFAIEGLDEITGGLVPSISGEDVSLAGGLISLVVGPPGSGKTTFCLSIATRMAALGSNVTYLTTEESRPAILAKLTGSTWRGPASWWPDLRVSEEDVQKAVNVQKLSAHVSLEDVTASLKAQFGSPSRSSNEETALYLVFPRVLVIDSLTALMEETDNDDPSTVRANAARGRRRQLAETLNELRSLGVCVLMIGSFDAARDEALEYLVDNVFQLGVREIARPNTHPVRNLHITKTRLQVSYTGQHVLHLSKDRGLVISPSISTVLSELKNRNSIPSEAKNRGVIWAPTRNTGQITLPGIPRSIFDPVTIRRHAHTLLYGRGSSGKARLGLLLCLEPKISSSDPKWNEYVTAYNERSPYVLEVARRHLERTRVLVISFLYGRDYYEEVIRQLLSRHFDISRRHKSLDSERLLSMLDLYPGLIDPETLVAKVRRELEMGRLAGRPYTAVLVDGVHNLVLQYPLLEEQPLLWPCLYRLFRAEGIDTVSTFTFFRVGTFDRRLESTVQHAGETVHAATAGGSEHLFFHLLVSSSDHSFVMESPSIDERRIANRNWVQVKVGSTIDGFRNEPAAFWWDPINFASLEAVE